MPLHNGDNLQTAIDAAVDGDVIELDADATFTGNFVLTSRPAGNGNPVTIRTTGTLPNRRIVPGDTLATIASGNNGFVIEGDASSIGWILDAVRIVGGINEAIVLQGSDAITFDRVVIEGGGSGLRRAIRGNATHVTLTRSHIANVWDNGADSQAFAAWDGAGPFTITDNYLEAAGENIMFGGADSATADDMPADILVENNYLFKPLAWQGSSKVVKNLFELKAAKRVTCRGNRMENCWTAGQNGYAIVLTPRNQDNTAQWSVVEDVLIENNVVISEKGTNIIGYDDGHPSGQLQRVTFHNNLFIVETGLGQIGGECSAVTFDHLTVINAANKVCLLYLGYFMPAPEGGIPRPGTFACRDFVVTNCVMSHRDYGFIADGDGQGTTALNTMASGYTWTNNAVAGSDGVTYPTGTLRLTDAEHAAQFANTTDYATAPGSQYANAGMGWTPLDIDELYAGLPTATLHISETATAQITGTSGPLSVVVPTAVLHVSEAVSAHFPGQRGPSPVTITIGGVDQTARLRLDGSLRISMGYRTTWTASMTLIDRILSGATAHRTELDSPIVLMDGTTTIFRGWVFGIQDGPLAKPRKGVGQVLSCVSTDGLLDSILVNKAYGTEPAAIANSGTGNPTSITMAQPHGYKTGDRVVIVDHVGSDVAVNGTHVITVTSASNFTIPVTNTTNGGGGTARVVTRADVIFADLHATYLAGRDVTLDTLSAGADIARIDFKRATLRSAWDFLMQVTGWVARITPAAPQAQFYPPGAKTATYALSEATRSGETLTWAQRRNRKVNWVWLDYGVEGPLIQRTDTVTGDGSNNNWALRYQPALDANGVILSSGGVFETGAYSPLGLLTDIVTSSVANPTTIRTRTVHGLVSGDTVVVQGHAGSTPNLNGTYTATVTGVTTFTVPVNVTVAGVGGSVYRPDLLWLYYPTANRLFRVGALAAQHTASFTYSASPRQRTEAHDSTDIAAHGIWEGSFDEPTVDNIDAAQQLAQGILRQELTAPQTGSIATRLGFVMPGDRQTWHYPSRVLDAALLVQQVEITADADRHLRYTLTAVTGDEFQDSALDIAHDLYSGGGYRSAAGGSVSGGALIVGPSGLVPGTVQGSQVIIEKRPNPTLVFHPIEVPDPDVSARRTVELSVSPAAVTLAAVTRDGDMEAALTLFELNRGDGTASFGNHGAWLAYTPIWSAFTTNPTLNNGTLVGRWTRASARVVHFEAALTIGSTTVIATGTWFLSLPVPKRNDTFLRIGLGGWIAIHGTDRYTGRFWYGGSELTCVIQSAPVGTVSDTTPFTWGVGDILLIAGSYEEEP